MTKEGCQKRQERLRQRLSDAGVDAIAIVHPVEIYYFTGVLLPETFPAQPALLWIQTDGSSWLAAHSDAGEPLVDACYTYECSVGYTMNSYMRTQLSELVADRLRGTTATRVGYQREFMVKMLADHVDKGLGATVEWIDMDEQLHQMQEIKDEDEIALIRKAVQVDLAAYDAAQATIAPGVSELQVLGAAQQAAHLAAGEKVFHDGDYQCGQLGGFARDRKIEDGELYIIDAWLIYRGYWADLCRTFAVGEPTELQESIYDHLAAFHDRIGDYLQPGKDSRECARAMDAYIRELPALAEVGLGHHGGHTIGLRAHQMPDVNVTRGGVFEIGNVVSIEPGAYIPEARSGVRLENMYLITASGPENLSQYPMEIRCRS
ncbi:MAG: aminopeptidase P family protein [Gemmatimonadetes bacterium]|nr:aminopeptidase P family protein [Gemmatimonadota bacterium]